MAKTKHLHRPGRIDEIPPWCYMRPGMTAMQGAKAAIRALGSTHPLDVLLTLWALQGGMARRDHSEPGL